MSYLGAVGATVAQVARSRLAALRRRAYLLSGAKRLRREGPTDRALRHLRTGWGNQLYSADLEYLRAVLDHARRTSGPILECGSGLTTIALLLLTEPERVWSLEHDARWAEETRRALRAVRVPAAGVVHAPLRSYGEASWYSVPDGLPPTFDLVVCDGPPGSTPGGRSGIRMGVPERIQHAVILLDDVARTAERDLAEAFGADGWHLSVSPGERPYAVLTPRRER